MGRITVGIAAGVAPLKSLTAELAEEGLTTADTGATGGSGNSGVAALEVLFLLGALAGEFVRAGVTLVKFRTSALFLFFFPP